jgi:hypothetical protein
VRNFFGGVGYASKIFSRFLIEAIEWLWRCGEGDDAMRDCAMRAVVFERQHMAVNVSFFGDLKNFNT